MEPQIWQLWILASIAFGVLELKLSNFVFLWFAVASVFASLAGAAGLGINGQLILFTGSSVGLFALSRTLFHRFFMRNTKTLKSGTDAMVGAEATVIEALPADGSGTVRINGELWSARSLDGAVGAGERVQVEGLEGLKLNVRRRRESLTAAPRR